MFHLITIVQGTLGSKSTETELNSSVDFNHRLATDARVWQKSKKHSVRINWPYRILNVGHCMFYHNFKLCPTHPFMSEFYNKLIMCVYIYTYMHNFLGESVVKEQNIV